MTASAYCSYQPSLYPLHCRQLRLVVDLENVMEKWYEVWLHTIATQTQSELILQKCTFAPRRGSWVYVSRRCVTHQQFKTMSVLCDWLSWEVYWLVMRVWMRPKYSSQTFLLLWMVPCECPNDPPFQKSFYAQVSFLLQWIMSHGYYRLVPMTDW